MHPGLNHRLTAGTVIRAMSPAGIYWPQDFWAPTAACVNAGDLIFAVSHYDEDHQPDEFYTDFDDPRVEEIRLYAALMLSVDPDDGAVLMLPTPHCIELASRLDLTSDTVVRDAADLVRQRLNSPLGDERAYLPPLPPCAGGLPYDFREDQAPLELQRRLHEAIDVRDYLLMRGLGTLIRSEMMLRSVFRGEAIYSLFISLDASFSMVLRKLRASGLNSPTALDAQAYIEDAFSEPFSGMRYFEEFYEDRISALHPESRLGTFPYLRLSISEGYQLSRALRAVWRHLILGSR